MFGCCAKSIKIGRDGVAQNAFDPYRGDELGPGADIKTDAQLDEYVRRSCHTRYPEYFGPRQRRTLERPGPAKSPPWGWLGQSLRLPMDGRQPARASGWMVKVESARN